MVRYNRFILLFLVLGIGVTLTPAQKAPTVQFGVGVSLVDFQDVGPYPIYGAFISPNLMAMVLWKQRIKIEPMIAYFNTRETNNDDTSTSRAYHLGVGIYWLIHRRALRTQIGAFIETIHYEKTDEYSSGSFSYEGNGQAFGPAVGVEYLFAQHFSIGTMIMYQWQQSKETRKYSSSPSPERVYNRDRLIQHLRTKIVFRFYF